MQDDLEGIPPSAKLVVKLLEWDGPLTQQELAEQSLLPQRTVRDALRRLREIDAIESEMSFRDARQKRYWLNHETAAKAISSDDAIR